MTRKSYRIFAVLLIAVSVLTLFFDYRWTTGWLLGCLVSLLLYRRVESFWGMILDRRFVSGKTGRGNFLGNYLIMAATLLICAFFGKFLNIYSCALGLMAVRFTSVIEILITRKG